MAKAAKASARKGKPEKGKKAPAKASGTGSRAREGGLKKKLGRPRKPDRIRGKLSALPPPTCHLEDAQRWCEVHGIGTTEDAIAITWMEVDKIGPARELNGSRLNWMRLQADLRKLLQVERMADAGRGATVHRIETGPQTPPDGATDPPELPQ